MATIAANAESTEGLRPPAKHEGQNSWRLIRLERHLQPRIWRSITRGERRGLEETCLFQIPHTQRIPFKKHLVSERLKHHIAVTWIQSVAGAFRRGVFGTRIDPATFRRADFSGVRQTTTEQTHSFTCRRNGDNTFIAVDLHCRLQSSGAVANSREKLLRAGTLH